MSQSNSVTSDLGSPIDPSLTQEEREALRAEWQGELNQVEDEIQTLRQVAKTYHSNSRIIRIILNIL